MKQKQIQLWFPNVTGLWAVVASGHRRCCRPLFLSTLFMLTSMGVSATAVAAFIPSTTANWFAHVAGVFPQVNVGGHGTTPNGSTVVSGTTGNQDTPCGDSTAPRCGNGDASAGTSASFGRLGVSAVGSVLGEAGGFGDYGATSDARFDDRVTATSYTLPFGTPVSGTLILSIHGILETVVYEPSSGSLPTAQARFTGSADLNNGLHLSYCVENSAYAVPTLGCHIDNGNTIDISMGGTFNIGSTYAIDGIFNGAVGGQAGSNLHDFGASFALVDAGNTTNIYLQPMGDFFFVSASGHDYLRPDVNPAPEPTSLALLTVGFAGLYWSRRRRI